jgi:hypothetical protein
MLLGCTPTNVADAEKKKNVGWLETNGSPEAIAALGRLADDDKAAQDALANISKGTESSQVHTDGGGSALDVNLAVWGGVERNASWATAMTKTLLADKARMDEMASAIKRGAPALKAFVPDLDAALSNGCGISCGAALASVDDPAATTAITKRIEDSKTRDPVCFGIGTAEATKAARDVFMKEPMTARDAIQCGGAAVAMATRDDGALAWLAQTAEPGLLRGVHTMPCARQVPLWTKVFTSRDHATFGALIGSLEDSVQKCPKELDATLAGALGTDVDTQTLVLASLGSSNVRELKMTCAAAPAASQRVTAILARANARDFVARCAH